MIEISNFSFACFVSFAISPSAAHFRFHFLLVSIYLFYLTAPLFFSFTLSQSEAFINRPQQQTNQHSGRISAPYQTFTVSRLFVFFAFSFFVCCLSFDSNTNLLFFLFVFFVSFCIFDIESS